VYVRVTYKKKHLYATLNVKRSQVLSTCAGCLDAANSIWHLGWQKHNKYIHTHTEIHTEQAKPKIDCDAEAKTK